MEELDTDVQYLLRSNLANIIRIAVKNEGLRDLIMNSECIKSAGFIKTEEDLKHIKRFSACYQKEAENAGIFTGRHTNKNLRSDKKIGMRLKRIPETLIDAAVANVENQKILNERNVHNEGINKSEFFVPKGCRHPAYGNKTDFVPKFDGTRVC